MIVSRHTLGLLVRNTTISAHEVFKNLTETHHNRSFVLMIICNYLKHLNKDYFLTAFLFIRYAMRRQFIEEMYHRYKSNLSISE